MRNKKFLLFLSVLCLLPLTGCSSIKTKNIENNEIKITGYKKASNFIYDEIIIPSKIGSRIVTTIGTNAFNDYCNYHNIVVPNTIKKVEEHGFFIASYVYEHNVYYEGSIEDWCQIDMADYFSSPIAGKGVLYIKNENGEFEYNSEKFDKLTDIVIPSTITEIKPYLFSNLIGIQSITIPDECTTIGDHAFRRRGELSYNPEISITFGSGLKKIGAHAFYLVALKEIVLNEGIEELGSWCFYRSLNDVSKGLVLPTSLLKIGREALPYSYSKTSGPINLYYKGNIDQWEAIDKDEKFCNEYELYFYSEVEPSSEGNYWHYSENNEPIIW